jgi:hypothetical protein
MKFKLAYKHDVGIITRNSIPLHLRPLSSARVKLRPLVLIPEIAKGTKSRMVDERYEAFGGMDRGQGTGET